MTYNIEKILTEFYNNTKKDERFIKIEIMNVLEEINDPNYEYKIERLENQVDNLEDDIYDLESEIDDLQYENNRLRKLLSKDLFTVKEIDYVVQALEFQRTNVSSDNKLKSGELYKIILKLLEYKKELNKWNKNLTNQIIMQY